MFRLYGCRLENARFPYEEAGYSSLGAAVN